MEKIEHLWRKIILCSALIMCTVTFAFADIANAGQNAGQLVIEQAFWIALAAVAVVCIKFLIKKAWTQFAVFLIVGGIVLFVMKNPANLQQIGATLFNIIAQ